MIQYKIATTEDIAELMAIRLEMLREVYFLSKDYAFSEELYSFSRDYFLNGQHTTVFMMPSMVSSQPASVTITA